MKQPTFDHERLHSYRLAILFLRTILFLRRISVANTVRLLAVLTVGWFFADLLATDVQAQLFGERNLGQGVRRNEGPGTQGPIPDGSGLELRSLDPERFVRGQRRADAFVGGQMNPAGDFVGREIPVTPGAIRSAIDGTLPRRPARRASQINRPLPPAGRNTLASPRFVLSEGPGETPPMPFAVGEEFLSREDRLTEILEREISPTSTVQLEGRRAVIQGWVNSEHQRRLAEIMIRFEPGVDEVVNRLEVVSP